MIPFIEITDIFGAPGYIRSDAIEALSYEPETGNTRIFVGTGGFYRVKESQRDVLAKLRDIESLKDLEGMQ